MTEKDETRLEHSLFLNEKDGDEKDRILSYYGFDCHIGSCGLDHYPGLYRNKATSMYLFLPKDKRRGPFMVGYDINEKDLTDLLDDYTYKGGVTSQIIGGFFGAVAGAYMSMKIPSLISLPRGEGDILTLARWGVYCIEVLLPTILCAGLVMLSVYGTQRITSKRKNARFYKKLEALESRGGRSVIGKKQVIEEILRKPADLSGGLKWD